MMVMNPVILRSYQGCDGDGRKAAQYLFARDPEHLHIFEEPFIVMHLLGNVLFQVTREFTRGGI